jgi:hypothetical protein
MSLSVFLKKVMDAPETITFDDSMSHIGEHYVFQETAFQNGDIGNTAGQNSGSCKIFAFGHLNNLSEEQTLNCFGDYYRKDVLENPSGDDHQNIRNFMKNGWQGIRFQGEALILK